MGKYPIFVLNSFLQGLERKATFGYNGINHKQGHTWPNIYKGGESMGRRGMPVGFLDWLFRSGKYQEEGLLEKIFNALKK